MKIDFYYAHPKENFIIPDMVYMQSNLIFEDFILNELKNNSNTKYKVFTFFSSAALNLYSLSTNNRNLEIVSIYSESTPKNYINNYNIFKTLKNNSSLRFLSFKLF